MQLQTQAKMPGACGVGQSSVFLTSELTPGLRDLGALKNSRLEPLGGNVQPTASILSAFKVLGSSQVLITLSSL
jgi:hypothetical protein